MRLDETVHLIPKVIYFFHFWISLPFIINHSERIMNLPDEPKVLIFYSNPQDTSRLRLDKENRALDLILQRLNLPQSTIRRLHATSAEDLARALHEKEYDIVQFSGHGSEDGIYLEDLFHQKSSQISAPQITAILRDASPNLKATLFISCFSAASIPKLIDISPYLVTISNVANDEASIEFISEFYDSYFRHKSIEKAFIAAQTYLSLIKQDGNLNSILSRRAIEKAADHVLFQVFPTGLRDSILIDLTEANQDIQSLSISRDSFLSLLTRKIRVHRWIFDTPRERAILSVGRYFGLFSWQDANDVVVCHKIMQIRPDVDEPTCDVWASLIVAYNDLYADKYRTADKPFEQSISTRLKKVLDRYQETFDFFFEKDVVASIFRQTIPEQFKVTKSVIGANLRMGSVKFHEGDFAYSVMYLETALSSIHDLLDSLTGELTR